MSVEPTTEMRYASSPSDAVQLYADLVSTSRRLVSLYDTNAGFRRYVSQRTPHLFLCDADGRRDWFALLAGLPIYYWTSETAQLVLAASQNYPLMEEEAMSFAEMREQVQTGGIKPPGYLPRLARGLAVFGSPVLRTEVTEGTVGLSAVAWHIGLSQKHQELWLCIRGISWYGAGLCDPVFWSDGGSKSTVGRSPDRTRIDDPHDTFEAERLAFIRWICSASMFVEQDIVRADTAVIERHFRKRVMAVAGEVPPVKVVTLRRTLREPAPNAADTDAQWHHRWVVRGHWRRQFFPARSVHCPIWIHPHVKGPEDKPFLPERETVFAVRR